MNAGGCLSAGWGMNAGWCCWLLLLTAAVDCCCWLLLLVVAADCCCWLLLLVAAADCCCWCYWDTSGWQKSLWIFPGYWWFAADNSVGQKCIEYFGDTDDLRLRKICCRKSLWIFSPRWWRNLAKTSLRNFCEQGLSSRIMMRGKWRRVSRRGNRPVVYRKPLWKMRVYGLFIPSYGANEWLSNRRAPQVFVRSESGSSWC